MSLFTTLKDHLTKIKQSIDEWWDKCDQVMEQWREEDPESYYAYIFIQHNGKL